MRPLCLATTLVLSFGSATLADPISNVPPTALEWERTPEGVAFAALEGDRFSESYMAMVQLPAGLVSPAHVKSADMFGVILAGTMIHEPLGAEGQGQPLPEGSYYHIPAGVAHVSSCVSRTDCVTFLYQPGAFDFVPVAQ